MTPPSAEREVVQFNIVSRAAGAVILSAVVLTGCSTPSYDALGSSNSQASPAHYSAFGAVSECDDDPPATRPVIVDDDEC